MKGGIGVLVGHLGTLVGGAAQDVLADHDDREHDELDEGLAEPLDER